MATDSLGNVTTYTYDAAGNQLSATDARGNKQQFQYDALNRRITTTYPDGSTDQLGYDTLGRNTSKTDQAGRTTQFGFDKLGRLTTVTDALNQITSYGYDEVGSEISQTDANNHVTTYQCDKMRRRTQRTLPLGMAEFMTYDAAGNLQTKTDFNGKTTTYAYDSMNRLLTKTPDASFGEPAIQFTYTASGKRASMLDASGTTNYTYDNRDRLLTKAAPQGTLTYTWDPAGNLLSIQSSNTNGTNVNYSYDQLNRLSTVTDNRLAAGVSSHSYDLVGNLASVTYPNGLQSSYTYDNLNRLTNLTASKTGTTLASYAYTLGPAGDRLSVVEATGRQVAYTYDALYRLAGETITSDPGGVNGAVTYTLDPVGNRLSRASTLAAVPSTSDSYDANDRISGTTYDLNGNTITSGANTYVYNSDNRLKQATPAGVTLVYDGDGNRVASGAGGVTTTYLVDTQNPTGYAQVFEELTGSAVQRVYTYGLARISESQLLNSNWTTSFYGYDGHGSVSFLTNVAGAVTDTYAYDAYGNSLGTTGSTPNCYRFVGEALNPSLPLYYLRARHYNAGTGRFLTMDLLGGDTSDPATLHQYLYANSDPVDKIDPSGNRTRIAPSPLAELPFGDILAWEFSLGEGLLGTVGFTIDLSEVMAEGISAQRAAVPMVDAALANLQTWRPKHMPHFKTLFRSDTAAQWATARANFEAIKKGLAHDIFYIRDYVSYSRGDAKQGAMSSVGSGVFAIVLGPGFFQHGMTGLDSRPGTILHETSHIVLGTGDYASGRTAVQRLSPEDAIRNADTYEYYAEESSEGQGP